jgi:hypothetical protein
MKCPKCGNQDQFRAITWEILSNKVWFSKQDDNWYNWDDSKNLDVCDSGMWPRAETLCEACGFDGEIEQFDDGNLPAPIGMPAEEQKGCIVCQIGAATRLRFQAIKERLTSLFAT